MTSGDLSLVLDFKIEDYSIKVWRYASEFEGDAKPADGLYRLQFAADYSDCLDNIPFHEVMFRLLDLIAGTSETFCGEGGSYPFSKSQFLSMAGLYSQPDSKYCLDMVEKVHQKDVSSLRNATVIVAKS